MKLLQELSVPVVLLKQHLMNRELDDYIILTFPLLCGDESLLSGFVATAFGPQGHSDAQQPRFPLVQCDTHLIPLLFATPYCWQEKKKCINNVFIGCIHPQINGNTKPIYKDGWLKAIFDHFHCARSLLPFLSAH